MGEGDGAKFQPALWHEVGVPEPGSKPKVHFNTYKPRERMNLTMEEESLPWVGTEPYPWWAVVPDQLTNKSMEKKAV